MRIIVKHDLLEINLSVMRVICSL